MRVGQGLDIAEHEVGEDEAGPIRALDIAGPVVAVARGDDLLRFDDPRAAAVQAGRPHRAPAQPPPVSARLSRVGRGRARTWRAGAGPAARAAS